jgi:hypothetical protein
MQICTLSVVDFKKMFFLRTALCLLALCSSVDARVIRGVASIGNGGLNLNLGPLSYFNGSNHLLNWWQTGSSLTLVSSTNSTLSGQQLWDCDPASGAAGTPCAVRTKYLQANGELVSPLPSDVISITKLYYSEPPIPAVQFPGANPFNNKVWDVSWSGCTPDVSVAFSSLGSGAPAPSFGANSGTITFGTNPTVAVVRFTVNPGTPIAACYTSPPTNIWVSLNQFAADKTACMAGTRSRCFDPDALNLLRAGGGILRLMDWMQTNSSGISDISQLSDFTDTAMGQALPAAFGRDVSISSGVMTVQRYCEISLQDCAPWYIGAKVFAPGITPGSVTIASYGTGTGGNGTYNLTCSGACPTVSSVAAVGMPPTSQNYQFGAKGGVHPNVACALAQATGSIIEYPFPTMVSDSAATAIATVLKNCTGARWKISWANEIFNGKVPYYYAYAQAPITGDFYSGYRAAQIAELVANVFGTPSYNPKAAIPNTTSRWWGALGSFFVSTSTTTDVLSGANSWISGGSAYTLTQLIRTVDVAPYLGPSAYGYFGNVASNKGVVIDSCPVPGPPTCSNITSSTTPTILAANHQFVNGECVALFVSGGTMASVMDSNATPGSNKYATVANAVAGVSFQITGINTTGLTYANPISGSNYALDCTIAKMADQSAALNASTPATYPTKYSFFAQQFSKSIIAGTASDASYGTYVTELNLSASSNQIPDLMAQQKTIATANGIQLSQYEAGPGALIATEVSNPYPVQIVDFLSRYQFDNGVTGDTTCSGSPCNVATMMGVMYQAFRTLGNPYSAQFTDNGALTKFGPWSALPYWADFANPKWQAVVNENAKGIPP